MERYEDEARQLFQRYKRGESAAEAERWPGEALASSLQLRPTPIQRLPPEVDPPSSSPEATLDIAGSITISASLRGRQGDTEPADEGRANLRSSLTITSSTLLRPKAAVQREEAIEPAAKPSIKPSARPGVLLFVLFAMLCLAAAAWTRTRRDADAARDAALARPVTLPEPAAHRLAVSNATNALWAGLDEALAGLPGADARAGAWKSRMQGLVIDLRGRDGELRRSIGSQVVGAFVNASAQASCPRIAPVLAAVRETSKIAQGLLSGVDGLATLTERAMAESAGASAKASAKLPMAYNMAATYNGKAFRDYDRRVASAKAQESAFARIRRLSRSYGRRLALFLHSMGPVTDRLEAWEGGEDDCAPGDFSTLSNQTFQAVVAILQPAELDSGDEADFDPTTTDEALRR